MTMCSKITGDILFLLIMHNYMKYNDTKFITHENFQLSSFQKCAKFYTHKFFYVYGIMSIMSDHHTVAD